MPDDFERARGMLRRAAASEKKDPEIEESRKRQARIEERLSKAYRKGHKATIENTSRELSDEMRNRRDRHRLTVPSYAEGGKVGKTGIAMLHEGEEVVPPGSFDRAGAMMGGGAPVPTDMPVPEEVEEYRIRPSDNGGFIVEIDFAGEGKGKKGRPSRFTLMDRMALNSSLDEYFGPAEEPAEEPIEPEDGTEEEPEIEEVDMEEAPLATPEGVEEEDIVEEPEGELIEEPAE